MVCLEIVNLFSEDNGPDVFADEFDRVEIVDETRTVSGKTAWQKKVSPGLFRSLMSTS